MLHNLREGIQGVTAINSTQERFMNMKVVQWCCATCKAASSTLQTHSVQQQTTSNIFLNFLFFS
jgi:hypothetical protein